MVWDFPGGPVVKTPHSQCRGAGLIPGQGTKIPHASQRGQKKKKRKQKDFPGSAVVKNLPDNAGDTGSSPGLGGSHMLQSN